MIPSLEGWPTKTKEVPSPHEVRLAPLDTNPVFQSLGDNIASQEKNYTDYSLLSEEILLPSGDVLNFFNKYSDLYDFWTSVLLKYIKHNEIVSQQENFLKVLMNGFSVYKNISKPKNEPDYKAGYLYLKLLGNPNKTVDDILFLKTSTDEYKNEIYLQASILFDLREKIL